MISSPSTARRARFVSHSNLFILFGLCYLSQLLGPLERAWAEPAQVEKKWVSLTEADLEPLSLGANAEQIRAAMKRGEWTLAARLINVTGAPQTFLKGWCYAQAERWELVISTLEDLKTHPILGDEVFALIAESALKLGKAELAVEAGKQVSKVDLPLWRENLRVLGQALRTLKRWDEANKVYVMLSESPLEFEKGIADLGQGMVSLERGQTETGLRQLKQVMINYPSKWVALQADREARLAIKNDPNLTSIFGRLSPAEQIQRAEGLLENGQFQKGIQLVEPLLSDGLSDDLQCRVWIIRGRGYAKLKKYRQALTHLDKALSLCHPQRHPQTPLALYVAGRTATRLDERETASRHFMTLLSQYEHRLSDDAAVFLINQAIEDREKRQPFSPAVARQLKQKSLTPKQLKQFRPRSPKVDPELNTILDVAQRVVKRHPQGDLTSEALTFALIGMLRAGRLDLAEQIVQLSAQLPPSPFRFHDAGRSLYWRARLKSLAGDREEAQRLYQLTIANAPIAWYALMAYSRLYELNPSTAQASVKKSLTRPMSGLSLPSGEHYKWDWRFREDDPHWALMHRALMWMRLGLMKRGLRDFRELSSYTHRPDLQWLSAWALDGYQQYHWSHDILRRKLIEYRHFPPSGNLLKHWMIAYPAPYREIVQSSANAEAVPPTFIWGVMREESGYAERIQSSANAVGLLQLILPTAKMMQRSGEPDVTIERLGLPEVNIPLGARYLAWVKRNVSCAWSLVPAGYNAGGGALKRWISERGNLPLDMFVETIPYEEARWYTKRVNASWITFRSLYGVPQGEKIWPYISQQTLVPEDNPPALAPKKPSSKGKQKAKKAMKAKKSTKGKSSRRTKGQSRSKRKSTGKKK